MYQDMKHKNITLGVGLCALLLTTTISCTNSYEDYNQDPYAVSKEEMQRNAYSLSSALINLESWVIPTDVQNAYVEAHIVATSLTLTPVLQERTLHNIVLRMVGIEYYSLILFQSSLSIVIRYIM